MLPAHWLAFGHITISKASRCHLKHMERIWGVKFSEKLKSTYKDYFFCFKEDPLILNTCRYFSQMSYQHLKSVCLEQNLPLSSPKCSSFTFHVFVNMCDTEHIISSTTCSFSCILLLHPIPNPEHRIFPLSLHSPYPHSTHV